jgi:hypothetical protein
MAEMFYPTKNKMTKYLLITIDRPFIEMFYQNITSVCRDDFYLSISVLHSNCNIWVEIYFVRAIHRSFLHFKFIIPQGPILKLCPEVVAILRVLTNNSTKE